MSVFKSLNLLPSILEEIHNKGYTDPTPIQAQCIPHLLAGKDLLGIAQTGTGKTAAFSLPILDRLGRNKVELKPNRVRTLILTPTRELASQIGENINLYGRGLGLSSKVIYGGVGIHPQIDALTIGLDILVATPGRLLDLMRKEHVNFDQLEVFVLDEADMMLDMGFLNDVRMIVSYLPNTKQSLLFSATMPKDIERLANKILVNPVKVEVATESSTVELVEQKIYCTLKTNKILLLQNILEKESIKSVLVFVKTKFGADIIVDELKKVPITVAAIHSAKSQTAREEAIADFRAGKIRVLVATDIAARGLDIPHVDHVINFNLPEDPRYYVHRIGRTARAGKSGTAITLCVESAVPLLKNIEKIIQQKISVDKDQPFHQEFSFVVRKTKAQKIAAKKMGNRKRSRKKI